MLLIRSQLYNFLMYFTIFVVGTLYAPLTFFTRNGAHRAIARVAKINRWLLKTICGITYEVRGKIPNEACLVLSKHMNFLDIVILGSTLPQPKFVMKASLKYVPILGFYASAIGSAPVHRGERDATKRMLEDLEKNKHLNEAGQLVLYPQGTRVLPGVSMPYKNGAWRVYSGMNAPCYLAATNAGVVWARKSAYRYPGKVILEFLPDRIEPGMGREEFMALISEKIETRSNELMAEFPAKIL